MHIFVSVCLWTLENRLMVICRRHNKNAPVTVTVKWCAFKQYVSEWLWRIYYGSNWTKNMTGKWYNLIVIIVIPNKYAWKCIKAETQLQWWLLMFLLILLQLLVTTKLAHLNYCSFFTKHVQRRSVTAEYAGHNSVIKSLESGVAKFINFFAFR